MLRILHLVDTGQRYSRSKGVRERRQEEPPLGNLAVPCHLEENVSHHLEHTITQHEYLHHGAML